MSLFSLPSPLLSSFLILLSTFFYFFVSYSPLIPSFNFSTFSVHSLTFYFLLSLILFLILLSFFFFSHPCLMSYRSYLIFSLSSHFHSCLPSLFLLSTSLFHSFLPFYPFFPSYVSFSTFSLPSLSHLSISTFPNLSFLLSFITFCFLTLSAFSFPTFFPLILLKVPFPINSCHIKICLIFMVDCNIPNLIV